MLENLKIWCWSRPEYNETYWDKVDEVVDGTSTGGTLPERKQKAKRKRKPKPFVPPKKKNKKKAAKAAG